MRFVVHLLAVIYHVFWIHFVWIYWNSRFEPADEIKIYIH